MVKCNYHLRVMPWGHLEFQIQHCVLFLRRLLGRLLDRLIRLREELDSTGLLDREVLPVRLQVNLLLLLPLR